MTRWRTRPRPGDRHPPSWRAGPWVVRPRSASILRPPGAVRPSALDRARGQATDEEPLQGEEDDDRDDHRDQPASGDQVPALRLLADQLRDGDRDRLVLARPDENQGREQVVPDP